MYILLVKLSLTVTLYGGADCLTDEEQARSYVYLPQRCRVQPRHSMLLAVLRTIRAQREGRRVHGGRAIVFALRGKFV